MALIPIQDPSVSSGAIQYQSADPAGDWFVNDGETIIRIIGPSAEFTLAFKSRDCAFGEHPPLRHVVSEGSTKSETMRFNKRRFDGDDGYARIAYEPNAVGIQVAATRIPVQLTSEGDCS